MERGQVSNAAWFDNVQLFADRARGARSGWRLCRVRPPTLVSLLYRLEGVPLAIELVASRAGVLTLEQMLSRLSQEFAMGFFA